MQQYTLEPANFSDYRDFLKHRFDTLKGKNKKYSINACAQKSKISKALLQFIFNKKRHLGLDRIPDLAKSLKLSSDEEYFVYLLVCHNSSRNPAVRNHFENILQRIRHEYIITKESEPERSKTSDKNLYLDYLFMVLQTFVKLPEFKEDPQWIAKELFIKNLSESKIAAVLKEIETLGYIYRDENSRLQAKAEALWRPDPYDPKGHKVYTKSAEALASLMQYPELYKPAVYMSMCLALDETRLLEAEKLMIEMHHRLVSLSKLSENPSAVVFIGNFLLTLARLKENC